MMDHTKSVEKPGREDEGPVFLQNESVQLRLLSSNQITRQYVQWVNDGDVNRYLETGFFPQHHDDVAAFVESAVTSDDTVLLGIHVDGQHVGNIKLGPISWVHRRAPVGIMVGDKSKWGQGIATEAISLVTEYAFDRLNLEKLVADPYEPNVGSVAAFKKVGYVQEGIRERHGFVDGEYIDMALLAIWRDTFASERSD